MSIRSIVYVEDDVNSRIIMDTMLRRLGCENLCILEDSGDIERVLHSLEPVPELVLLDIHMTPVDGFGVLKIIRSIPTYMSTKIVALTASFMSEEVKLMKDAGFDSGIAKPINPKDFGQVLERILAGEVIWQIS